MRGYAIVLLWISTSCEAPVTDQGLATGRPDRLVFHMKTKERTSENCIAGAEGCTYIRFDYPVLVEAPTDAAITEITEWIRSFLTQPLPEEDLEIADIPALMGRFLERFRAFEQRSPGSAEPWFLERKAFVLYNSPLVLSLSFSERFQLGGERRGRTLDFVNLDPSTGEAIALSELMVEGYEEELASLAEARFRQVRGIEEGTALREAGFTFEKGRFTLTDNFAITEEGLTFCYNPGEIAPVSLGSTEIVLGYDELEPLLRPNLPFPAAAS